jgi:hypothetical protein
MGNNGGQGSGQSGNQGNQGNQGGGADQRNRTGATTGGGTIGGSEAEGHGIRQDQGGPGQGQGGQGAGQGKQQRTDIGTGAETGSDAGSAAEVQGSQMNTPPTQPDLGAGGRQGQVEGREIN